MLAALVNADAVERPKQLTLNQSAGELRVHDHAGAIEAVGCVHVSATGSIAGDKENSRATTALVMLNV